MILAGIKYNLIFIKEHIICVIYLYYKYVILVFDCVSENVGI